MLHGLAAALASPPPIPAAVAKTVTATVRDQFARLRANLPVHFVSADPSVATVAPASVLTDNHGNASATVTGVAEGSTTVTVSTESGALGTLAVTVTA